MHGLGLEGSRGVCINQAEIVSSDSQGLLGGAKMALDRKWMWEEMLAMLHPFTIAVASLASRQIRSMCVSPNGLLIVPYIIVFCDDFDGPGTTDQMLRALPAIDKGEVVEIEICDGRELANPVEKRDRFSLCLGWLLGPFNKLRAVSIDVEYGLGDQSLWVTMLLNLKRHCPKLEHLSMYSYPQEVIKALPTFQSLTSLHMAIQSTPHAPATSMLERLADCSSSLPALDTLLLEVAPGTEECLSSLQRCLDAFPLCYARIIEIVHDPQAQEAGTLPGTLSHVKWPPKCRTVSLSSLFSGEDLCALAEQICLGTVNCLYLTTGPLTTAAHAKKFLATLEGSQLKGFGWEFPDQTVSHEVLKVIGDSACSLVQHLKSLRVLEIGSISGTFEPPDLSALAEEHRVHWRRPDSRRW